MFWMDLFLVVAICAALCMLAYAKNVLTLDGAVAALAVGIVIGLAGGISWILLLLLFLVTSFAATRYKFSVKKKRGQQEGIAGERGWKNVIANGLPALTMAILTLEFLPYRLESTTGAVLFLCSVSVAASDTLASEIGVLARKTWMITTMRRVKAGVNGGFSIPGQASAAAAAVYTATVGILVFHYLDSMAIDWLHILLITGIGFFGCQVDSLIGATLETEGRVSKLTNNLISISFGTFVAWMVMAWLL